MIITAQVKAAASRTVRARQLESMFDVPPAAQQTRSWRIDAPLADRDWTIGLIVGPSGSGKSTILHQLGTPASVSWQAPSVIDDFAPELTIRDVTDACSAVGFNTIPAWLRPYSTLSVGEQFRVTLARLIAEADDTVLIDEFSSVVDRQVAKIGSHAVARYARARQTPMILASCHYDVIDWLQPDWLIEPHTETFTWRDVNSRPKSTPLSQPVIDNCGGGSLAITI